VELELMQARARAVRERYDRLNEEQHGRAWTVEELMLGFVGDVGDLSKLVQGRAGIRPTADLDAKIAHELADCLWSVFALADSYGIDLGDAFESTMTSIEGHLEGRE
jgi:NTP pyrophosphatase (non-canonical NTP hydrolase)